MKLFIALSLFIFMFSHMVNGAGILDNLTPRGRAYVKAGVGIADAISGSRRPGKVEAAGNDEICIKKFEEAQKAWSEKKSDQDLLGVIYLQYPLYGEFVKELPLDIHDIPANSWNPYLAPHIDSQCKKFWQEVGTSELFENDNGALCKVSTVGYAGHEYDVVACAGEMRIKIDLNSVK